MNSTLFVGPYIASASYPGIETDLTHTTFDTLLIRLQRENSNICKAIESAWDVQASFDKIQEYTEFEFVKSLNSNSIYLEVNPFRQNGIPGVKIGFIPLSGEWSQAEISALDDYTIALYDYSSQRMSPPQKFKMDDHDKTFAYCRLSLDEATHIARPPITHAIKKQHLRKSNNPISLVVLKDGKPINGPIKDSLTLV